PELQADELGTVGVAVLFQPIGEDEARRLAVRFVENGLVQGLLLHVGSSLGPPVGFDDGGILHQEREMEAVTLRTNLMPGDLGWIVYLHGTVYAREYGFDPTFEAYVAGPLAEFVRAASERERIWIAERASRIVGCVAIVAAAPLTAQLRW